MCGRIASNGSRVCAIVRTFIPAANSLLPITIVSGRHHHSVESALCGGDECRNDCTSSRPPPRPLGHPSTVYGSAKPKRLGSKVCRDEERCDLVFFRHKKSKNFGKYLKRDQREWTPPAILYFLPNFSSGRRGDETITSRFLTQRYAYRLHQRRLHQRPTLEPTGVQLLAVAHLPDLQEVLQMLRMFFELLTLNVIRRQILYCYSTRVYQ